MTDDAAADVVRRRRAVFGALLTVFPEADAHAAVAIWDRDYRHGRSVYDGLNVFARQVCGQFAQPGRHRELIQRLMEYFFAPETALPPDPGPHTHPVRVPMAAERAPLTVAPAAPLPSAPRRRPCRHRRSRRALRPMSRDCGTWPLLPMWPSG